MIQNDIHFFGKKKMQRFTKSESLLFRHIRKETMTKRFQIYCSKFLRIPSQNFHGLVCCSILLQEKKRNSHLWRIFVNWKTFKIGFWNFLWTTKMKPLAIDTNVKKSNRISGCKMFLLNPQNWHFCTPTEGGLVSRLGSCFAYSNSLEPFQKY